VTIAAAVGTYQNAGATRSNLVRLVISTAVEVLAVQLNGTPLSQYTSQAEFEAAESGWLMLSNNVIIAKSAVQDVASAKQFVVQYR
jgi:hypothetical protein